MTDQNNQALDVLIKEVLFAIDKKTSGLTYDKTFETVILAKNNNGTYKIRHLDQEYNIKNALAVDDLKVGQRVWVKIPSGMLRKMHVCGIVR